MSYYLQTILAAKASSTASRQASPSSQANRQAPIRDQLAFDKSLNTAEKKSRSQDSSTLLSYNHKLEDEHIDDVTAVKAANRKRLTALQSTQTLTETSEIYALGQTNSNLPNEGQALSNESNKRLKANETICASLACGNTTDESMLMEALADAEQGVWELQYLDESDKEVDIVLTKHSNGEWTAVCHSLITPKHKERLDSLFGQHGVSALRRESL